MSFPQTYCTGPVLIFCEVGSKVVPGFNLGTTSQGPTMAPERFQQGTPALLGTAEAGPKIIKQPYWKKLRTSEGGEAADDMVFMGEEVFLSAHLNWFDEAVYAQIGARPMGSFTRGRIFDNSVGTLMRRERKTFKTWFVFPFDTKTVSSIRRPPIPVALPLTQRSIVDGWAGFIPMSFASMANMPPGYRFFATYVMGPDTLDPLGSQTRAIDLVWHCMKERKMDGYGNATIYDHVMDDLLGYVFTP